MLPWNLTLPLIAAGEHCSPLRPTAKPPLCKGRWHGVSRDGGIGACMGVLGCTRKVAIPQSALPRSHRSRGRTPLSLRDISPHCGESPFTQGGLLGSRRGAFHMLPWNLTLPLIAAGEQCSPLQSLRREKWFFDKLGEHSLCSRNVWRPRKAMRANNVRPYTFYTREPFYDNPNRISTNSWYPPLRRRKPWGLRPYSVKPNFLYRAMALALSATTSSSSWV